jgi:Chaperone of endosialidase
MGIAYVSANDTFLIWMLKTNQSIDYQNQLNGAMNAANDKANSIYLTTNAAYNNANVGLVSANAYAGFMVNTATDYAGVMANSANGYANTVGNSGNAYSVVIGASGNAYANVVGISGNTYANVVGISGNAYANFVGTSSNNWSNAYSNQVGINSNTYTNVSVLSANAYAGFMSNSVNAWANVVGVSGNAYAVVVGASSNAYINVSTGAANNYAGFMANSSNNFAANLAYGSLAGASGYANYVGASANSWANAAALFANNYTNVCVASVNAYANLVGISGNTYTNLSTSSANNYAGFMANSANAFMLSTTASDRAYTNTSVTAANNWSNNYANVVGVNANNYANATFVKIAGGYITGDLAITGNIYLSGNATTVYSTSLVVGDSLLYLAANNYGSSDTVDIGFVANYTNSSGSNVHTGLYRSSSTKQYYLFNGYDIEPGANNKINPFANNMTTAILNADIVTNNLWIAGANANVWISGVATNAAAAFAKANSVSGGANAYAQFVGAAGNTYAFNVGLSGNAYAQQVGASGNTYAASVASSAQTTAINYAAATGTSANNYAAATFAPLGGSGASGSWNIYAYPRRSDGGNIVLNWSGQSGQPSWLLGGNDGTNFYVYNPSNFNVNSATYASYCNGYQFNQWLQTGNAPTFAGLYSPSYYYRDNTGYYVFAGNANARISTLWGDYLYSYGDIRAAGYIYAVGRLVVGEGQTLSYIEMRDTDEGTRYLHNNSGTIGFLNSGANWRFRVSDDGNVVMGIWQDWVTNQFRSNIFYRYDNTGYYVFGNGSGDANLRNVYVNYLQSYGSIYAASDITAYSDQRLKKNVTEITNATEILNKIRGVRFNWIKDDSSSIGVIAQEIEPVVPEVIKEVESFINHEKTNIKTVDYGKLVSVLIAGWKDHEKEINDLKSQVAELTKKLSETP